MIGLDALPRRHQSPLSSPNVLQNDRSGLCICNKSRGSELKATVIGQPRRAEGAVKTGMPRGALGVSALAGGRELTGNKRQSVANFIRQPKKKSTPEESRFIPGFRFGSLTFRPGGCGMMPSRPALAGLRFNSLNTQSLKDLVGFVTWGPS